MRGQMGLPFAQSRPCLEEPGRLLQCESQAWPWGHAWSTPPKTLKVGLFAGRLRPTRPTTWLVETRLWAQCAARRGLGEGHGRGGHGVRHSPAAHSLGVSPVSSEARVGAFTCAHLHRFPTAGHRAGGVLRGRTDPCGNHSGPSASRSHLRALSPRLFTAKSGAPLRPCVISECPWGLLWARGGEGVGCGLSQGAGPLGQRVPQGTSQRGMGQRPAQGRALLWAPAGLSSSP